MKISLKSLLELTVTFDLFLMNSDFENFHNYVIAPVSGGFLYSKFNLVKQQNKLGFNKQ